MTSGQAHDQRRQLSGDKVVLENLNIGAFLEARAPSAFQDSGQNTVGETAGSTLICFEPTKIPYVWDVGSGPPIFRSYTDTRHQIPNVG